MYSISAAIKEEVSSWGEFTVNRSFEVLSIPINSEIKRRIPLKERPTGFIVQQIKKMTKVYALCGNKVKEIRDIEGFTDNNVKYMNFEYYEVFPVINGKATHNDRFQNGAVLRYEPVTKKYRGKSITTMDANNNPPTKGTIIQIGMAFFIEADKSTVEEVKTKINSRKKYEDKSVQIFGMEWDLNNTLPSAGLPFRILTPLEERYLFKLKQSLFERMYVRATWDGIPTQNSINKVTKSAAAGFGRRNNNINNIIYNNKKCPQLSDEIDKIISDEQALTVLEVI